MRPILTHRYVVEGILDGAKVHAVYKSKPAALRFAEGISHSEIYDRVEQKYIGGTSKFIKEVLSDSNSTRRYS